MQEMKPARATLAVLAAAIALGLAGCETMPKASDIAAMTGLTGGNKIGQLPPRPAARQWPDAAQDVRNQRARGYGLVAMPELQAYLNALLARIKAAAGVPDWPGAVYVIAGSDLEAYSTAAGNIYVSIAWLGSMESEDEVVAVLSHEFGHIYSNSHQLETVVATSDQFERWAAVGVGLAYKTGAGTVWTPTDTLTTAYTTGRESLAPAWSRSEEEAADRFGTTVSLQLGYSYSQGFKAFLERLATWENENKARKQEQRKKLMAQQSQDAALATAAAKPPTLANAVDAAFTIGQDATKEQRADLGDWVEQWTSSHPSTEARLSSLTEQVTPLIAGKPRPAATVKPWQQALAQRNTAAIVQNYAYVVQAQTALGNLDYVEARRLALQGTTGATSRHALPNAMLSMVEAAGPRPASKGVAVAQGAPLDRNLSSEPDRAWRIYVLRGSAMAGAGQVPQARTVMAQGFNYFGDAPAAWPDEILFVGRTDGWDAAKKLAQSCASRFPSYARSCIDSAQTPAETAKAKRDQDQKPRNIVDHMIDKLK